MVCYENECCDCATPEYPCLGNICPHRNVKHLYCDKCGEDVETLYICDGYDLCEDCLKLKFEKIEL